MTSSESSATSLARETILALLTAGIRDVVLSPGSRNAPLGFAALDADRAGVLRLHTRIDERSAGFLALGLTRAGSRAAVVCTSGTAVANLHPAVLEAAHSGVGLVAVTADRPAAWRGTDANQTTDQVGIFGRLVETVDLAATEDRAVADADVDPDPDADAADDLRGRLVALLRHDRGPIHLNLQFAEPLTPPDRWVPPRVEVLPPYPRPEPRIFESIVGDESTVVVAGAGAGDAARVLAEAAGLPLLAEPSSGARSGPNAMRTRRLLLRSPIADRVRRAIVFGSATLDRETQAFLARDDVEVWAKRGDGVWDERLHVIDRVVLTHLNVQGAADPSWLADWRDADRGLARGVDALVCTEFGPHAVAAAVAEAASGGLLVVGASNPIRDLDLMAAPAPGTVIANRGLAGIDGVVSTAIGAALAVGTDAGPNAGPAYALMGDVTFLHDSNGLILGPDEPRPDLVIVVVNDDGGSIFATLEQGRSEYADSFERLFGTPHHVDIASLCAATRTPHLKVTSRAELTQALASPNGGIEVIEVPVARVGRRDLAERLNRLP